MFGRNDWNGNGSYDYSDHAMDMMSMRYVMTDGTWEDDDDIAHAEREDDHREESRDWDDDECDAGDKGGDSREEHTAGYGEFAEYEFRNHAPRSHITGRVYVKFPRSARTPNAVLKRSTVQLTHSWRCDEENAWEIALNRKEGEWKVELCREPDGSHGENAIGVYVNGVFGGYLSSTRQPERQLAEFTACMEAGLRVEVVDCEVIRVQHDSGEVSYMVDMMVEADMGQAAE